MNSFSSLKQVLLLSLVAIFASASASPAQRLHDIVVPIIVEPPTPTLPSSCNDACAGQNVGHPGWRSDGLVCMRFFTDAECLGLGQAHKGKLGNGNDLNRECLVQGGGSYTWNCKYENECCANLPNPRQVVPNPGQVLP